MQIATAAHNNQRIAKTNGIRLSSNSNSSSPGGKGKDLLNSLTASLARAKVNAKQTGEQYAWEAHRNITKMGEDVKQTAKVTAKKTGERMKESITEVSQSTASKLKDRIASRIPKMPKWEAHRNMTKMGEDIKQTAKLTVKKTGESMKESITEVSQSTASKLKDRIASRIPKMPKLPFISNSKSESIQSTPKQLNQSSNTSSIRNSLSSSLPTKEALLKSATYIATETASKTASNVTTQVSESVNKATRWLWWWGLAAVGVYGMSTTLTKEGVLMFKEMITSSKESLGGGSSISAEGDAKLAAAVESSNATYADKSVVESVDDEAKNKGRWLSLWFSSRSN